MELGIEGRVALVTGGTGYLGAAVAESLRKEGVTVLTASRSSGEFPLDVQDESAVKAAVQRVVREHGSLDIVVMSVGTSAQKLDPALSDDPGQIAAQVDAKALSTLRVANAALPLMRERGWGRFVAINGQNVYMTASLMASVRNVSLAFIAGGLADAYAGTGVTVNVVNPGPVQDGPPIEPNAFGPGDCTPQQVAAAVTFLVSEAAGTISGESVAVGHKARAFATY
jgi:NAD(P)-dependent dehydrogenase (short-subunit alcohol dehydrogenase family)